MVDAFQIFNDSSVKKEFKEAFERLDEIEIIQLLSDLKYLPLKAYDSDSKVAPEVMAKGIQKFREELKEALAHPKKSTIHNIYRVSEVIDEQSQPNRLSKQEVFVLKEITGLDNELVIHDIKKGEVSLLSRVLIYRYRVYDLVTRVLPNHKITSSVIDELQKAAKNIGFNNGWITFANLISNQEKLSSFCLESPVLSKAIFGDCIFFKMTTPEGRKVVRGLGQKIKKKRAFIQSINSEPSKKLITRIANFSDRKLAATEVNKFMNLDPNIFMRRVLQVKLWIMGLYQGHLDDYFGPLSIKALNDYLVSIISSQNEGNKELGRIIYNMGYDQCIVNIRNLLSNHFIPIEKKQVPEEQSSVSQVFDFVLEDKANVTSLTNSEKKTIKKESTKLKTALEKDLRVESRTIISGKQRKVRHYKAKKGILKFFSKLFKFVKNAITKIIKLIKKLLNIIKERIKIIYSEIREAFQNFKDGLRFLFGKRTVQPTEHIITDYDFDFDGITILKSNVSAEDIDLHRTRVKKLSSSIYTSLNFVRIVIKWGLSLTGSPFSWVKILVGIAKLFRAMLRKNAQLKPA